MPQGSPGGCPTHLGAASPPGRDSAARPGGAHRRRSGRRRPPARIRGDPPLPPTATGAPMTPRSEPPARCSTPPGAARPAGRSTPRRPAAEARRPALSAWSRRHPMSWMSWMSWMPWHGLRAGRHAPGAETRVTIQGVSTPWTGVLVPFSKTSPSTERSAHDRPGPSPDAPRPLAHGGAPHGSLDPLDPRRRSCARRRGTGLGAVTSLGTGSEGASSEAAPASASAAAAAEDRSTPRPPPHRLRSAGLAGPTPPDSSMTCPHASVIDGRTPQQRRETGAPWHSAPDGGPSGRG
jgi:hypothetical protein